MKRALTSIRIHEKMYFYLLLADILFILLIGTLGFRFLSREYTREINLISNISGAVLSQYPDAESALLSAVQDGEGLYLVEGYAILEKYGYRESLFVFDNSLYRAAFTTFLSYLLAFFFCSLAIILFSSFSMRIDRRMQEKQLLTLLDRYLAEDYSFLETPEEITPIFNPSFTDSLLKLGHKLMLKTQRLSEERDNTKTLVTDISHQLKTPISALKNCLSICIDSDTPSERDEFLERCSLQLNKLESLVAALINISRLETSLITLHRDETNLSDIFLDAVNTVYVKALQKKITVEILDSSSESAGDPGSGLSLFLDRKWTAEALANILDNAVKYSPVGSTVTIRLLRLYSYIRIEIEDQGIGIPEAEYNRIFKRFYRGSDPAVQACDGSGVGLYLSRRIIGEQGGSVTVKPAADQGSVFIVQLPLLL